MIYKTRVRRFAVTSYLHLGVNVEESVECLVRGHRSKAGLCDKAVAEK